MKFFNRKEEVIDIFNGRLINYHNSKLPEERGASGYSWKIMRGEKNGQLTLHQIATKIDTGSACDTMNIKFSENVKCPADYYKEMEKKEKIFFSRFSVELRLGCGFRFELLDNQLFT